MKRYLVLSAIMLGLLSSFSSAAEGNAKILRPGVLHLLKTMEKIGGRTADGELSAISERTYGGKKKKGAEPPALRLEHSLVSQKRSPVGAAAWRRPLPFLTRLSAKCCLAVGRAGRGNGNMQVGMTATIVIRTGQRRQM